MDKFTNAWAYTLTNEGGDKYTDIEGDQPTKYGITLLTLQSFFKEQGLDQPTRMDVQFLSFDLASKIALKKYWTPLGLGDIQDMSISTAMFDIGFNTGVRASALFAQRTARVPADGIVGPATISAINRMHANAFLADFIKRVQSYYCDIVIGNPEKLKFLNGWLARSQRLMTLLG